MPAVIFEKPNDLFAEKFYDLLCKTVRCRRQCCIFSISPLKNLLFDEIHIELTEKIWHL
jgi:hypothetical protein